MYGITNDATVYLRLTTECGWSETRYADLMARILNANLSAP